jgi:hypothetical protein
MSDLAFWDRFWGKVDVGQPDECWEWQAGCYTDKRVPHLPKYGCVYRKIDGVSKYLKAHRVAYESANGAIPEGMQVLHTCDNPPCCNPDHLYLGTPQSNTYDKVSKNRHVYFQGEAHGMAKLNDDDISDIRLLLGMGCTQMNIAREFGVHQGTVSRIKLGKNWSHV